jgi:hypothetical protein
MESVLRRRLTVDNLELYPVIYSQHSPGGSLSVPFSNRKRIGSVVSVPLNFALSLIPYIPYTPSVPYTPVLCPLYAHIRCSVVSVPIYVVNSFQ